MPDPQRFSLKLRHACSAGEPLNPEVIRWFADTYGTTIFDYYGLTESYPLCSNFPTLEVRPGSMGKPTPGWDVQLLDADENPVPVGEMGEICLRAQQPPLPARLLEPPGGQRGGLRRRVVPHQGRRAHG